MNVEQLRSPPPPQSEKHFEVPEKETSVVEEGESSGGNNNNNNSDASSSTTASSISKANMYSIDNLLGKRKQKKLGGGGREQDEAEGEDEKGAGQALAFDGAKQAAAAAMRSGELRTTRLERKTVPKSLARREKVPQFSICWKRVSHRIHEYVQVERNSKSQNCCRGAGGGRGMAVDGMIDKKDTLFSTDQSS